ncbi:uncharacterized protein LOC124168994 isoform X2 [Ischnura elegans]|nr:uncharacterized protein LOC124168994 isoform X2 [Ischnura elegans]
MSDEALKALIDRLQMSTKLMKIENCLFEVFSSHADPSILSYVNQASTHHTAHPHGSTATHSFTSVVGRRTSIDSVTSVRTSVSKQWHTSSNTARNNADRMQKLSVQQKMDIVARETENLTSTLEEHEQKWKQSRGGIIAAKEEATFMLNLAKEALGKLENGFENDWLDPITGRVPAERFIRFIKEQIHIAEGTLDQCRLKTSTLKIQYKHAKEQLHDKEELGETLFPIDFDLLVIDISQMSENLQKKNQYLLDLKKILGRVGPSMAEKKKNLWKQNQELKTLKQRIAASEATQAQIEKDYGALQPQISAAKAKINSLKNLISGFKGPGVMDYIKIKAELDETKMQLSVWTHRWNILKYSVKK